MDYLHDVCYDWYGDRLATCSSDQRIRIFQRVPPPAPPPSASAASAPATPIASSSSSASASSSSPSSLFPYTCVAELRGHNGSIHRLSFCHPEYGTLLASCSTDRTVLIHEERKDASAASSPPSASASAASPSVPARSGYSWKARARLTDSSVSVVDCEFAPAHLGLLLATLGLDGKLRVYESRDLMNLSHWGLQDDFHTAEAAALTGPVQCAALSWNPSPFDPPMLAVACNSSVKLFESERGAAQLKWRPLMAWTDSDDAINDVAWAPNIGRSYHLIASAGKDGAVRVYTLRWEEKAAGGGGGAWTHACVGVLKGHNQQVWRVSWNSTGSMLASTGDDGCTRVWKADYSLHFKQIAQTQTQPLRTS